MSVDRLKRDAIDAAQKYKARYKQSLDPNDLDMFKRFMDVYNHLSDIEFDEIQDFQGVTDVGNVTTNTIDTAGTKSDYFLLDTTATPTLEPGMFGWNDAFGTADLRLKGDNVTLQVGQEIIARVVNKTGADLIESEYKVVRVRIASEGGAQGQRLAVVLAQGDNDPDSVTTLGIVTETILDNQEGFITILGNVSNIDTTGTLQGETWVDGDVLYLSPTTPGALTKVPPVSPQHTVTMGYVVYAHQNQGKIFVKVDNGYELDELHNVLITNPQQDQVLKYDAVSQVWVNGAGGGGGATPTLDQVTTAGNTTTNAIIINGNTITPNGSGHKVVLSAGSNAITRMYFDSTATGGSWNAGMSISASSVPKWTIAGYGSTYDFTFYNEGLDLPGLFIKGNNNNVIIGASVWNPTDAGFKLDVNGTARVSSTLTASSFVKNGGTSSQFLKADGSVDSNVYLTSYTETDPIFTASPSFGITSTLINNWNTAFGWGNHATAGYVTLSTAQTITGLKSFARTLNIARTISATDDVNSVLNQNTLVSSGFILNGALNAPVGGNLQYANIGAYTLASTDGSGTDIYIRKLYSPTNFIAWTRLYTESFHPEADRWTTARTLTIGNTGKSVDGTNNVSWTVAEIGALPLIQPSSLNVNAANATGVYLGSTGVWSNRGPSGNNAGALITLNTHPGDYYSQFWFNTAANAFYHRTANASLPTATWQRVYQDDYHPEADKLTTARQINGTNFDGTANITTANWGTARTLTIGGTGKSVNGSGNVSWSLGEIQAEYQQPINTVRTTLTDPTIRDISLIHGTMTNKLRFVPATTQEESTDGINWVPSTRATAAQLGDLMRGEGEGTGFDMIPSGTVGTYGGYRLTWDVTSQIGYVFFNYLYMFVSTKSNALNITIERFHNTNGWEIVGGPSSVSNWPGHVTFPHSAIYYSNNASHSSLVRITFDTLRANTNTIQLFAIEWFGTYPAQKRNVHSFDRDKNAIFPAGLRANNLLLNTTTPAGYTLDVNGTTRIASDLVVDTNTLFVNASTDRVGIGTASPNASKLNVNSSGSSDSVVRIDGANPRGAARYALQIVDSDTNGRGSLYVNTTSGPSAMFVGGEYVAHSLSTDTFIAIAGRTNSYPNPSANSSSIITTRDGGAYPFNSYGNLVISSRHDSAKDILFRTNDTDRVVIQGSGRVGIGTNTPQSTLDVAGTIRTSTGSTSITEFIPEISGGNSLLRIKGGNFVHRVSYATSWNNFEYAIITSSYSTSDTIFDLKKSDTLGGVAGTTRISTGTSFFNGYVGVNTITPGFPLDIQMTTADQGIVVRRIATPGQYIAIHEGDGSAHHIQGVGDKEMRITNFSPTYGIKFYTNNIFRAEITNTGNVGINTTSPSEKLHVEGRIRIGTTPEIVSHDNITLVIDQNANSGLNFLNVKGGAVELMRVQQNGNVLIGTTTDAGYKLDVNGNARVSGTVEAVGGTSADWNQAFSWGDHSAAGYLQSGVGWTGTITIPSNPPGMQNIDVADGLIMNVF